MFLNFGPHGTFSISYGTQDANCLKCVPKRKTETITFVACDVSRILSNDIDYWSSAIFRYNRGREDYFRIEASEGSFKKQFFTNGFNVTDIFVNGIASLLTSKKPRQLFFPSLVSNEEK